MSDVRPDPDELLKRVAEEERRAERGNLTLFFGAAPGVGKTYAMLEAAREELAAGRDVLVGIVETHGRAETAALLDGLSVLERRPVPYRGVTLHEFDLDAALVRRPGLLLVDELAHTNAEGSRHPKRWQDVEELLDAGIDVFSTLNVQHVESLKDVVAQITGVTVRETVPDSMLEEAHEIRLADLPPDELLERLREGKVYIAEQAGRAVESFFRKGNLIALRELALRRTAERVDAQMRQYRRDQGIEATWAATERLLVCLSWSPHSARVVREASRMARGLHASWLAVYVETPRAVRLSAEDKAWLSENLRLAAQLGAEVVTVSDEKPAEAILRVARERNVTKIVVGKPRSLRKRDRIFGSFVDDIVKGSGTIDVYVTAGSSGPAETLPDRRPRTAPGRLGYLAAAGLVILVTLVARFAFGHAYLADVVMLYLLGVVIASLSLGRGPSLSTAVMSVLAFDFFFVPPYYTFSVSDFRHVVTFTVMLLVGVVINHLTLRVRDQATGARERERRTAALYEMSRALGEAVERSALVARAADHIARVFESDVLVFVSDERDLSVIHRTTGPALASAQELGVARWVFSNRKQAGLSTNTLPGSPGLFIPLATTHGLLGVLGVVPKDPSRFDDPEERRFLEAFAAQMGVAVERTQLSEQAQTARLDADREELRNALLSSVSHDLRTPLGVIEGASSALLDADVTLDSSTRRDLVETIHEEAERLNRRVRNLLDMTRFEAGAVRLDYEWQSLEEVVGAALARVEKQLGGRNITVSLPPDLPLVWCDGVLVEQVLVNLLENAIKYSPPDTPVEVSGMNAAGEVVATVADHGSGIAAGEEERIFEKFYRAERNRATGGVGLGLAICRAIVAAHGGRIWAENLKGAGSAFRFSLPKGQESAALPPREEEEPCSSGLEPVVLLVEDEPQMRRFLRAALIGNGYKLVEAETGAAGLTEAATRNPEVIILDLGLPDLDGLEVTRRLREWSRTPIIVISARGQEKDKVAALDAGADDYLTKPFGVGELLARLRVALRHGQALAGPGEEPVFVLGPLRVDLAKRQVFVGEEEKRLTPTEYRLLTTLVRHAGKVLTHRQLLKDAWGPPYVNETQYLRVYMGQLRHKLEPDPARPRYLVTEPGVGYRLRVE